MVVMRFIVYIGPDHSTYLAPGAGYLQNKPLYTSGSLPPNTKESGWARLRLVVNENWEIH